ncbi:MAG: chloride channel protein, partial [Thermoanaerobaculia bacterium]
VPARPILTRAAAAVATVGAGGSLGREGPMIRLGSMLASRLAIRFRLPAHRVKILVGCGAGAGLAAAYNIPIGGALFAMEVILGNFALEIFGPIVIASVIATLIARSVQGDVPIYPAPGYQLESGAEIVAYVGLGIVCALASLAFIFGVRAAREAFARLAFIPRALRPALGMALVGGVAILYPQVLGSGYETINEALQGGLPLILLLVLPAAKLVATALTRGSGGAGGLFTPSLFFGAVVGGAYGFGLHALFPEATGTSGAYALVGMAAIAAGTSHAPISAILILFEFTGNYSLILPLMIASITASVLARRIYPWSIYTHALKREGVELPFRMEEAVLAGLAAGDLARTDSETLAPSTPYAQVVERFLSSRRQRLFVVDEDGRLLGAVSLHDIKHALESPEQTAAVVAHDLMVPVPLVHLATDRLHQLAATFARSDFERVPVLDGPGGRYTGFVSKRDLLAVYSQEVLGRPALLATFTRGEEGAGRSYVELPPDFAVQLVPVPPSLVGRALAEAALPQRLGVRVLEIKRRSPRGEDRVLAGAATVLRSGDELIVLGPTAALERLSRGEPVADEAAAHAGID